MAKIKKIIVFLHFMFGVLYGIGEEAGFITKTDNYDEKVDGIFGGVFWPFS